MNGIREKIHARICYEYDNHCFQSIRLNREREREKESGRERERKEANNKEKKIVNYGEELARFS